jgi:ankyrin repeat protein/serine/threonine protein kinase
MNNQPPSPETLLAAALDISGAAERRAYLDRACGGDAALRAEVESLLAANSAAGEFLLRPAAIGAGAAQETVSMLQLTEKAGTRIGRYKLLEQIGEGGFGVVWMAEQEEPVRRRVALKVIKLGMDTKEVVARFEAERQALAMMDHPHIASVFDGGATDTGRPYFVMELVKGVPITAYCDANQLSTRERLDLFMQVCQAVQHAHQKGIIHRDLKPSNILVTVKDDRAVPKVIDFGIAKATQARLTEKTIFTRLNQWIGTPAYMSPEQAGLGSLDVDTRSDIYSLGVLLYELLTGRTPFDTQKLLAAGYDAVMRTIREEEPPKPSTRLSTLGEVELNAVAAQRGSDSAKLNRLVRGDLDWIVMKCLEKNRTRRYEAANDLARDIERHLGSEPVSAAAPGLMYLASKFVRRHRPRLAFAALAIVAVALAVTAAKFALNKASQDQDFVAKGTNTVFAFARSGEVKALNRLLNANPNFVNERDAGGATPLSWAASAGATNTLRLLITRGASMNATNRSGLTALGNAAANNQPAALVVLLEAGADPNHADAEGVTPLHAASLYGSVEMGRVLIAKGAKLDAPGLATRVTALQQAAMLGYADFVDLLLRNSARVDVRDSGGNTPLHAAASGKTAVGTIRASLEQLATRTSSFRDNQGLAGPIQEASNRLARIESRMLAPVVQRAGGQHRRVAESLLARQADLEATNGDCATPLLMAALFTNLPVAEVLVANKANLDTRAKDGSTPLNIAALRGSAPLAEALLKAGANLDPQDDQGFTPLNTAIEQGHPGVAKLLLARGANPSLAPPNGQTPLHTAAGLGDLESMRLLLDHGAPINAIAVAGTPLSAAVQYHKVEAVKLLLQRDAKPDVAPPQNGMTALHWAATVGHEDVAKLLLEAGAMVDASSSWQGTPLNAAASGRKGAVKWFASASAQFPDGSKLHQPVLCADSGYLSVLRLLLAAKANVNAREPHFERTPIFAAVTQGQLAAVEALLAAGADLKAQDRQGMTPLHAASAMDAAAEVSSNIVTCLLRAGADVEARDQFRGTPLHAAANAGKPVVVALLLEARARVNAAGPDLCTPLQLAVMRGRRDVMELLLAKRPDLEWRNKFGTTALHQAIQLRAMELATMLIERGADVDAATTGRTNNGITALMFCAHEGYLGMMKLLLDHGAQLELTGQAAETALGVAAAAGQMEAARLLLDRGAKLEAADQDGTTAFMRAAKMGQLEMVKFLLGRDARLLGDRGKAGFTALHEAADRGHPDVVEFLLSRGMKADLRCDRGGTPLCNAANGCFTNETSYVAVVKVLLAHSADVNARTRGNQTPLHRAAEWGRPQIMQALLAAGADPNSRDDDGKTALDIAKETDARLVRADVAARRKECQKLLRKALSNLKATAGGKERIP